MASGQHCVARETPAKTPKGRAVGLRVQVAMSSEIDSKNSIAPRPSPK